MFRHRRTPIIYALITVCRAEKPRRHACRFARTIKSAIKSQKRPRPIIAASVYAQMVVSRHRVAYLNAPIASRYLQVMPQTVVGRSMRHRPWWAAPKRNHGMFCMHRCRLGMPMFRLPRPSRPLSQARIMSVLPSVYTMACNRNCVIRTVPR